MERLTARHDGVSVIADKNKIKEAMELLAQYEETGLTPEEVVRANDFVASGIEGLLAKIAEMEKERKWIPVNKTEPLICTTVLATIKHRRWISDMGTEDEEDHPERIEVCSVYFDGECYIKLDDTEYGNLLYIPSSEQEEDIEYPIEEVLAWMPLPEEYKGEI